MREFTCIICPRGCQLRVDDKLNVTGNSCKRGLQYALDEVVNPKRNITSTVKINSIICKRLPVKTDGDFPKDRMFDVMRELNKVEVTPPIKVGDIIIENILNLKVNLVSTREILK